MGYFLSKYDHWLPWDKPANKVKKDQKQSGKRYFLPMSSMCINLKEIGLCSWEANRLHHYMKLLLRQTCFNSYKGSFLSLLTPGYFISYFYFSPKSSQHSDSWLTLNCRDTRDWSLFQQIWVENRTRKKRWSEYYQLEP